MFVRSENSAFSSPDIPRKKEEEGSKLSVTTKSTADRILQHCDQLEHGISQLLKDKVHLTTTLASSTYRDEHLNQSVAQIQNIIERATVLIMQAAEVESRTTIWKDLETRMRESLAKYQQHLKSCRGRRDYLECQECLDRLKRVLKSARDSEDESKLICCICLDAQVNCSARCGHLLCATCAQSIENCPICRGKILPEDIRPVFFA